MFLDINNPFPRGEPLQPKPRPPENRLTPRQEKILMAVIILYLLITFIAPIGGISIIQAFI
jgi:hypothetical protein